MPHAARLRKVGGSVMLAIPKPVLDELGLAPETSVDLSIKAGRLIIDPKKKHRYSLDELLRQCKRSARRSPAERDWVTGQAMGRELI